MTAGRVGMDLWIAAAAEVAAGAGIALVARLALRRLRPRDAGGVWRVEGILLTLLRLVVPWGAALGGVWLAAQTLPLKPLWASVVDHAVVAAAVIAATVAIARAATEAVRSGALSRAGIPGWATIFANITGATVLVLGALMLLESMGVAITPMLTALGIGGLAVALALQDTLANLFAGVHILASGKVRPGDFIQISGGQQGYVVDTNWRSTTIRELPNNLVVVPNTILASSVMTNYHHPDRESAVIVQVAVAYDSDLEHVERVTCEVGRQVMQEVEGGVPSHEPFVRYHTFADSSIGFSVVLRTREVTGRYLIVHEFIKRLHRRYAAERIEIPFPIRTIVHAPVQAQVPGQGGEPALPG